MADLVAIIHPDLLDPWVVGACRAVSSNHDSKPFTELAIRRRRDNGVEVVRRLKRTQTHR